MAFRLRDSVLRLLSALPNAMATACLIAFFFVGGCLVPIDASFFQSSTSVLILLLTTDWLDPFLRGMILLLSPESIEHGFHETRRGNRMFLSACAMFCSLVDRIEHLVPVGQVRPEMDCGHPTRQFHSPLGA